MTPNRPLNLIANYVGTGWIVLVQLVLVPVYVRLLGVEVYGLVGFFTTLQAVLQILDLGMSAAINRELARRTAFATPVAGTGDLVKTLEAISALVALGLGLLVVAGSSVIAHHWVNSKGVPPQDVARAIALMGLAVALQWPVGFYTSGLLGLQRQTASAVVNVVSATVFGFGVVALLYRFASVDVFLLWRALVSLGTALVLRRLLWSSLAAQGPTARVRWSSLGDIWAFSLGMAGIAATGMLLSQIDKIVMTKLLSLEDLGYYNLATAAALLLPQLVAPLFTAVFPALSQSVVIKNRDAEREHFHLGAQLMSLIVHPAAVTLIFFSYDILFAWTGNAAMAGAASRVLPLLAAGALLNSVMVAPYALQLAHGWTRVSVKINLVLLVVTLPYAIFATARWGMLGAASASVVMNLLYVCIGAPVTFRGLLAGEGLAWLRKDVLTPLACIVGAAALCRLIPIGEGKPLLFLRLLVVLAATYLAALVTAHDARGRVFKLVAARWKARPISEQKSG